MFRKLVIYSLIPFALAGTFASLSAGLAACAGQSDAIPTFTPAPMKTVSPTFTPTPDFLHMDRIPGLDPLAFNSGAGSPGEKLSLPQDVFAEARSRHLAPIEAEGGIASTCTTDSCTVMLTKYLVNGAQLQPATDGQVIYGFDGQAGSEALFRFSGLPEGVRATAFVAQDGNPWGYKPGTVVVWFWEGGSKGPATILNPDNPVQIMADKPNSISLTAIDNGLRITRTGPDGAMIEEQTVAFLSPLPSEFLDNPLSQGYVIKDGKVMVGDTVWYEQGQDGQWQEKLFIYDRLTDAEIAQLDFSGYNQETLHEEDDNEGFTNFYINGRVVERGRLNENGYGWYYIKFASSIGGQIVTLNLKLGIGTGSNSTQYLGGYDIVCNLSNSSSLNFGRGGFGYCSAETLVNDLNLGELIKIVTPYELGSDLRDYLRSTEAVKTHGGNVKYHEQYKQHGKILKFLEKLSAGKIDEIEPAEWELWLYPHILVDE